MCTCRGGAIGVPPRFNGRIWKLKEPEVPENLQALQAAFLRSAVIPGSFLFSVTIVVQIGLTSKELRGNLCDISREAKGDMGSGSSLNSC